MTIKTVRMFNYSDVFIYTTTQYIYDTTISKVMKCIVQMPAQFIGQFKRFLLFSAGFANKFTVDLQQCKIFPILIPYSWAVFLITSQLTAIYFLTWLLLPELIRVNKKLTTSISTDKSLQEDFLSINNLLNHKTFTFIARL